MAKKSKIVQDENGRSSASKKRSTRAKKSPEAARKKAAAKTKGIKGSKAIEPTDEEIRIRAYFIAERRHRLELIGDADTDWLEAKRQLLSELEQR